MPRGRLYLRAPGLVHVLLLVEGQKPEGGTGHRVQGAMSRHLIVCTNKPMLVEAASRTLEGTPRLTVSESGLQVLATLDVVHVDLLVLDLETPGVNPLLLTSAIRALAPGLPILAVSAHPLEESRDLSHKGVAFVTLPADQAAWGQALGAAMGDMAPGGLRDGVRVPTAAGAH